MKQYLIYFFLVFIISNAQAQVTPGSASTELSGSADYSFTMDEAVAYALDSSYANINARRDILSAIKKKWETTALGLPHISSDVKYSNNLKLPVQLVPAEFFGGEPGTFLAISFGTQNSLGISATANQLLFDGSYIVGLQAAKTFLEYSENAAEKTVLQTRQSVISAYGNVLLARASVDILKKNVALLEKNVFETQKLYDNGLTELESVEQLQITLSQIENQLSNAERMMDITQQLLKLTMGIPISQKVELEDNLESLTTENIEAEMMNNSFNIQDNIDYQIAKNLTEQSALELKLEKSKYLPSLNTFLSYGTQANSNEFTFLDHQQKWFQYAIWGVNLHIPIFSSWERNARTQQAKIALEKAETQFIKAQQQIWVQLETAKSNYRFAIENYQTAKENLNLAQRIADKNQIKFAQGLASSFELRQAQTQLYATQQELLQAMLKIITAKAELETIMNTPEINIDSDDYR